MILLSYLLDGCNGVCYDPIGLARAATLYFGAHPARFWGVCIIYIALRSR
jgi:hypothetical protein